MSNEIIALEAKLANRRGDISFSILEMYTIDAPILISGTPIELQDSADLPEMRGATIDPANITAIDNNTMGFAVITFILQQGQSLPVAVQRLLDQYIIRKAEFLTDYQRRFEFFGVALNAP